MKGKRIKIVLCGGVLADIIVAGLPKVADPGEAISTPEGVQLRVGGHSANISRDLVKLGVSPRDIYFAAAIGNDVFGQFIESSLKKFEINLNLQRFSHVDTSKNVILVVKGEDRRFHFYNGAGQYLDPDVVIELLDEVKPSLFYAGAISGKLADKIEVVLRRGKNLGCITFLDVGLPPGKKWGPVLEYTDILHLNNLEAMLLAETEDLSSANEKIIQRGVKISFITSGDGGALVRTRDFELQQPVFKIDAIDPTGAGDAFCSGILYSLIERFKTEEVVNLETLSSIDIREIVLFGQAVGAVCCTGVGTTEAVSRNAVSKLIEDQGEKIRRSTHIRFLQS